MHASLTALLPLVLLAACSQAPVKPAQASAQSAPPPAATQAATPQICPTPAYVPKPIPVVQEVPVDKDHREVLIQTNYGDITVQLDATRAPHSVKSFLTS